MPVSTHLILTTIFKHDAWWKLEKELYAEIIRRLEMVCQNSNRDAIWHTGK